GAADDHEPVDEPGHLRVAVQGPGEHRGRAHEQDGDLVGVLAEGVGDELVAGGGVVQLDGGEVLPAQPVGPVQVGGVALVVHPQGGQGGGGAAAGDGGRGAGDAVAEVAGGAGGEQGGGGVGQHHPPGRPALPGQDGPDDAGAGRRPIDAQLGQGAALQPEVVR